MMIRDNMNLWSKLPDKLDLKPSLTLVLFPEWLICYHIKTTKINEKLVSCPSFLLYCVSEWAGSAPCSTNAITALPSLSSQCTASAWATEGGNSSVCIWLLHTYTFSLPLLFSQETKEICALWRRAEQREWLWRGERLHWDRKQRVVSYQLLPYYCKPSQRSKSLIQNLTFLH